MAEKPEDLNLPNAAIVKIVKDSLPPGINIAKDARQAIGKAASIFILYCTSCANNHALKGKRKTLTGQDVLDALEEMEFEHFIPQLEKCLAAYRRDQKNKRDSMQKRKLAAQNSNTQNCSVVQDLEIEEIIVDPPADDGMFVSAAANSSVSPAPGLSNPRFVNAAPGPSRPRMNGSILGSAQQPLVIDLEDGMNGEDEEAES